MPGTTAKVQEDALGRDTQVSGPPVAADDCQGTADTYHPKVAIFPGFSLVPICIHCQVIWYDADVEPVFLPQFGDLVDPAWLA